MSDKEKKDLEDEVVELSDEDLEEASGGSMAGAHVSHTTGLGEGAKSRS